MTVNKNIQQIVEPVTEYEKSRKFMNFYQSAISKNTKVWASSGDVEWPKVYICVGFGVYWHEARMR